MRDSPAETTCVSRPRRQNWAHALYMRAGGSSGWRYCRRQHSGPSCNRRCVRPSSSSSSRRLRRRDCLSLHACPRRGSARSAQRGVSPDEVGAGVGLQVGHPAAVHLPGGRICQRHLQTDPAVGQRTGMAQRWSPVTGCSRPGNRVKTHGTPWSLAARAEHRARLRTTDPAASGPEAEPKALRPQAERTSSGYARVAMRPRPSRANTWTTRRQVGVPLHMFSVSRANQEVFSRLHQQNVCVGMRPFLRTSISERSKKIRMERPATLMPLAGRGMFPR